MLFIAYRLPAWDGAPVGATSKFDVRHDSELRMKKILLVFPYIRM